IPVAPRSAGRHAMKRAVHVIPAATAAAVAALSMTIAAGGSQSAQTFRSAVSVVDLNVTVQDPKFRYITGLQLSDFAVYEDGAKQDIRFLESISVPIDLIVLLDTSASMT